MDAQLPQSGQAHMVMGRNNWLYIRREHFFFEESIFYSVVGTPSRVADMFAVV